MSGSGKSTSQPAVAGDRAETFPRSPELSSSYSPLFWIDNKDRFLRQLLIRDIEAFTKRRLCTYFCSSYFETSLSADDVGRLYEVVNTDDGTPFDLLLETSGGETDATEALIAMLQCLNRDFRVIVPSRAKSNGTVICLAAREIIMGPTSELGPIEPFINNRPVSILMTDEYKEHNFPLYQLGTDAYKQTEKLARALLADGMMRDSSDADQNLAIDKLCTRNHFYSHGSVINATEAVRLGLKVANLPPNDELWRRLWLLYNMYAFDSSMRGIGKFFEGRKISLSVLGDDPNKAPLND